VDQRYFIDTVRESVEPLMVEERARGGDQVSAAFTGMVPLVNRAQQSLLEGLSLGLATDLVLIIVTVIVLMRHWSAGLLMLAACVPPSLIVLGLLGWTGVTLDVGSVLAPSVAIGVSVDDVLHFILWFRRGLLQGLDRTQAVRLAYAGCARAMFQSWGVIGLGLGIFAFSDFTPTHRFGVLMFCLVSVGLVVNLVLLPALLAGFLGYRFARGLGLINAGPRTARPELENSGPRCGQGSSVGS
jgi:predicted RND superfamily exporter protein